MPIPTSSTGQSYPVIQGYKIVQQIGGGGFSRVFRAINPSASAHRIAAIKVVSYAKPSSQTLHPQHAPDRNALRKEVQIHAVLKHKNVLEFLGVHELMPDDEKRGNYVPGLYMVLELGAGGDLFDKIAPDVGVDEDLAHLYFSQLIAGLEYIHSQGVAHRDVKPENLLLDAQGCLKLADFGLCSVYRYKGKERELKGACGSLPYIAPEMNGNPYRGEPADVWSTGVVLFALLVGNTPWDEPTKRSPEFVAYTHGQSYDPWRRIQPDALSLLHNMLCVNSSKRYSIADVKRDRWYNRKNALMVDGRQPDPTSLAERLLHGLIVSGDMDFNLHSDGKRATVPENISLSQPETFVPGLQSYEERFPSSSAHPALGHAPMVKSTNARHLAMSQQVSSRRDNVPPASVEGPGLVAGAAGSQFTQAMNHMTQWSSIAVGTAKFSPHLTRLFCGASPSEVVSRVVNVFVDLSIAHDVVLLGPSEEDEEAAEEENMAKGADDDVEMCEAGTSASSSLDSATSSSTAASMARSRYRVGSRGAKIRVSTTDRRKCVLKGEVRVAAIPNGESEGPEGASRIPKTYVLMKRSKGDPLEWRRLFRAVAMSEAVKGLIVT